MGTGLNYSGRKDARIVRLPHRISSPHSRRRMRLKVSEEDIALIFLKSHTRSVLTTSLILQPKGLHIPHFQSNEVAAHMRHPILSRHQARSNRILSLNRSN